MSEGPRDYRFPAPAPVVDEPKQPASTPDPSPESRPFGNEPGHEWADKVKAPAAPRKAAKKAKAKK